MHYTDEFIAPVYTVYESIVLWMFYSDTVEAEIEVGGLNFLIFVGSINQQN